MLNGLKIALIALIAITCTPKSYDYARLVNPFIGTGGHGHTFPGATMPFGMVQLSPDTRVAGWDACSGYHYSDSTILGFSHTHLSGTGAADYGDILFTPFTDSIVSPLGFHHEKETAWAGYYEVELDNNIKVRLTTTTRVGIHEYSFKGNNQAKLAINLVHGIGPDLLIDSQLTSENNNEISGYRRSNGWAEDQLIYFVAQFSEDFSLLNTEVSNERIELIFPESNLPLLVKVGLSTISTDNARENIGKEARSWNFNHYVENSQRVWNSELKKVKADFQNQEDKIVFYSALYHSFLAPNTYNDINGEYRGMDKQTHISDRTHYTVFSLWDTFRAAHPLFTILNARRNVDMINTMLRMYEQSGKLPVWELAGHETGTMIGYHAIPVIADAILKNQPGFDYDLALEAMVHSANQDHLGLAYYKEMGYIPVEKEHESVSKTLEYAYDDWCIAQVADVLEEDSLKHIFLRRAQNYKNSFDPESEFMRPKRNGTWIKDFDPYEVSGNYTEANAWQYNYFVPHDIYGLSKLFGSKQALAQKLDTLFNTTSVVTGRHQPDIDGMIGQYAHGNEPSHNFAYLYNYVDEPWKTQELVRNIVSTLYSNEPDGLSGNEDCGQMSAWYVFSALGFYPAVPGSNQYVLGSPSIKKAQLKLENENVFKIETMNFGQENIYVSDVTFNGRPYNKSFILHEDIMKGGKLIFHMSDQPNKKWHNETIIAPESSIKASAITITPLIKGDEMTFLDSLKVSMKALDGLDRVFYTLDGSMPDSTSNSYISDFWIDSTTTIRSIAINKDNTLSSVNRAEFIKIPFGRTIKLKNVYSHLYTGNSSMALIDHIRGGNNFRDGWQGYHEDNLEAVIDLGEEKSINYIGTGFLQDNYSWIFYPEWVEFSFSTNGKSFNNHHKIINHIPDRADGLITQTLADSIPELKARYVKVIAQNIGKCPEWHKGAGGKAWLFADEIIIRTSN